MEERDRRLGSGRNKSQRWRLPWRNAAAVYKRWKKHVKEKTDELQHSKRP